MFQESCQKLNEDLLLDPECEAKDCNATSPYRTISGCCNNIANKDLGQTNRAFTRLMTNEYADSISLPRGGMNPSNLPSPRVVSSAVHRVKETKPKPPVSVMLMQFGQFLDHDMTLTPEQG
jgi:peroxidase